MKILITDGISPEGAKLLTDAGHEVCENKLTPEELVAKIGAYDCIIVRSATKVTKEVIEAGKNLKVIARGGVGVDNIDVKYADIKKAGHNVAERKEWLGDWKPDDFNLTKAKKKIDK